MSEVYIVDTTNGLKLAVKEMFSYLENKGPILKSSKEVYIKVNGIDFKKHCYTSPEFLEKLNMSRLKTVISTIPDYEISLHVLKKIKEINPKAKIILTGTRISETLKLYENGADFVITPKVVAGQKLASIIHEGNSKIKDLKKSHMKHLKGIHNSLY